MAILPEERVMQNPVRRSEHYREKAAKYHELAKRAHPPYLGEFYRGIAVTASWRKNYRNRRRRSSSAPDNGSTPLLRSQRPQDLNLLAVWAGNSRNDAD